MIELLALAQPPAIVAQIVNYRSDMNRSCPGFNSDDNHRISQAAVNHLAASNPSARSSNGSIRILFTNHFVELDSPGFWPGRGVPVSPEEHRLIELRNFTTQPAPPGEYRYVFFCPPPWYSPGDEDRYTLSPPTGFGDMVFRQIERWFDLPQDSLLRGWDLWNWFRIEWVENDEGEPFVVKGGVLFFVK